MKVNGSGYSASFMAGIICCIQSYSKFKFGRCLKRDELKKLLLDYTDNNGICNIPPIQNIDIGKYILE